jgi:DNA polymerase III delta prime subunit
MIQFTRATKTQSKLRCAIFGPSGSGKTYSALRIARGLAGENGRIALIDTEFGSASKYADRFVFDATRMDDSATPAQIEEAIHTAEAAGFDVLIIDGLTQVWEELKVQVERISKARYNSNYWAAWSEGTPMQKQFIRTILGSKLHIIATMRVKTHWDVEKDNQGKMKPVRKGLDPEQGKGIEYEFDLLLQLSTDHVANVEKDRTGKFQDKAIDRPDEDFGRELAMWLSEGEAPADPVDPEPQKPAIDQAAAELQEKAEKDALLKELNMLSDRHGLRNKRRGWLDYFKVNTFRELTNEQLRKLNEGIKSKCEPLMADAESK